MRLVAAVAILVVTVIPVFAQSGGSVIAFDVTPLAGLDTSSDIQDGRGDAARFYQLRAMWGDGTYLYVGDGSSLRQIEIATAQVTTITRLAGSGRYRSSPNIASGITGLWGDGSYIYATDVADGRVRRINLSTRVVDLFAGTPGFPRGTVGDAQYLYVGGSQQHNIKRVDVTTGVLSDFVTPDGPIDPYDCWAGSSSIGCFVPSPKSLWIEGNTIYATGFGTTLRLINTLTAQVTSSPELPFIPNSIWGRSGVLYYTADSGNRIGKLVLATGEASVIFEGDPARGLFRSIWGDASSLYVVENDHIVRFDVATGTLHHFVGRDPTVDLVDGAGSAARFVSARSIWSDGTTLFIADAGRVRKLDVITNEVTTLSTPVMENVWGDGTYLYGTDTEVVRRVRLSDGEVTTLGPLQNPLGGRGIWGNGTDLYVSTNVIERVPLDGGPVSTLPVSTGFAKGSDVWGDGSYLYVGAVGKVYRVSIADGQTSVLATIPAYVTGIWGDGQNLFVTGQLMYGSAYEISGRVWQISLTTGDVYPVMGGGTGIGAGTPLNLSGDIWGIGGNIYLVKGSAIYKLIPSQAPPFSAFDVPDRAGVSNVTAFVGPSVAVGSGNIEPDATSAAISGLAIFTYRHNGTVVSEATVPSSSSLRSGRIYASVAGPVNTGLAIMNPNDQPATVNFYFTDATGNNFGNSSFTIPARGQIAQFLSEAPFRSASPLSSNSVEGTLTFEASIPVAAIALRGYVNERSEFLMTTLPVLDLGDTQSSDLVVMPHFADGGGWTTSTVLVNPTDQTIRGNLERYSDDGVFLSATTYAIFPRSSFVHRLTNSGSQIQTGSIRIVPAVSTVAPSGVLVVSYQNNGVTVAEAGVPTIAARSSFRIYMESTSSLRTGVAITNPSSNAVTVNFEATTLQGFPIQNERPTIGSLTIPSQGHRAAFLNEIFLPGLALPSNGIVRIWTDSPTGVSVTGLRGRYNERSDFLITTTPPVAESSSPPTSTTYFPHIVEGGGYTTQITIFGNTPGRRSSGRVRYFSQSGSPLIVPLD